MAFTPISGTVPQYQKSDGTLASDYYIKFYQSGTTTAFSMATDSTGGTTLDKAKINSSGYPVNGSDAVFIPHVNQTYKIVLYKNATDADNDTTGNADWVIDNIQPVDVIVSGETLTSNNITYTPSGTGSVNTTVQSKLREYVSVKDFGAVGDGVTDDYTAINNAIATGKPVYFPSGDYVVGTTLANTTNLIIFSDGAHGVAGNDPQTNKSGTTITWSGAAAGPILNIDPDVATSVKVSNIKFYVDKTFTGKMINIQGSLVTGEDARAVVEFDGVGLYRTPLDYAVGFAPGDATAIGIYFDLTSAAAGESRACIGYKFNRIYLFNLNTGYKVDVADAVSGQSNFFNSNYFNDIYMYQVYRGLELIGGSGASRGECVANTFTSFEIQPGLDSSSVAADGVVKIDYKVNGNVFYGLKIWDIPASKKLVSSNLLSDSNGFFVNRIFGVFDGEIEDGFSFGDGFRNINFIPEYEIWNVGGSTALKLTSSGLFLGGSTAAINALNYFEESTFTPSLTINNGTTGITYTTQSGQYTRVGKNVNFVINITLSSKGSLTGAVRITGLPFTSNTLIGCCSVGFFGSFNLGAVYPLLADVAPSNTVIQIYQQIDGVTSVAIQDSDLTNTSQIRLTGSYWAS